MDTVRTIVGKTMFPEHLRAQLASMVSKALKDSFAEASGKISEHALSLENIAGILDVCVHGFLLYDDPKHPWMQSACFINSVVNYLYKWYDQFLRNMPGIEIWDNNRLLTLVNNAYSLFCGEAETTSSNVRDWQWVSRFICVFGYSIASILGHSVDAHHLQTGISSAIRFADDSEKALASMAINFFGIDWDGTNELRKIIEQLTEQGRQYLAIDACKVNKRKLEEMETWAKQVVSLTNKVPQSLNCAPLVSLSGQVSNRVSELHARLTQSRIVPVPHVSYIFGEPGVGKTTFLTEYVFPRLAKRFGVSPNVYKFGDATNHFLSYNQERWFVYDDFGAVSASQDKNPHKTEAFLKLCGGSSVLLPGPNITDKNQVAQCVGFGATGNPHPEGLSFSLTAKAKEAMLQRLHPWRMCYIDWDKNLTRNQQVRKADWSNVHFIPSFSDKWTIDNPPEIKVLKGCKDHEAVKFAYSARQVVDWWAYCVDQNLKQYRKRKNQVDEIEDKLMVDYNVDALFDDAEMTNGTERIVRWVYGEPLTGKTTFMSKVFGALSNTSLRVLRYDTFPTCPSDADVYHLDDCVNVDTVEGRQAFLEFYNRIPVGAAIIVTSNYAPRSTWWPTEWRMHKAIPGFRRRAGWDRSVNCQAVHAHWTGDPVDFAGKLMDAIRECVPVCAMQVRTLRPTFSVQQSDFYYDRDYPLTAATLLRAQRINVSLASHHSISDLLTAGITSPEQTLLMSVGKLLRKKPDLKIWVSDPRGALIVDGCTIKYSFTTLRPNIKETDDGYDLELTDGSALKIERDDVWNSACYKKNTKTGRELMVRDVLDRERDIGSEIWKKMMSKFTLLERLEMYVISWWNYILDKLKEIKLTPCGKLFSAVALTALLLWRWQRNQAPVGVTDIPTEVTKSKGKMRKGRGNHMAQSDPVHDGDYDHFAPVRARHRANLEYNIQQCASNKSLPYDISEADYQRIYDNLVTVLRFDNTCGIGIYLTNNIIMTAAHLVEDRQRVIIKRDGYDDDFAEAVYVAEGYDTAFLRTDKPAPNTRSLLHKLTTEPTLENLNGVEAVVQNGRSYSVWKWHCRVERDRAPLPGEGSYKKLTRHVGTAYVTDVGPLVEKGMSGMPFISRVKDANGQVTWRIVGVLSMRVPSINVNIFSCVSKEMWTTMSEVINEGQMCSGRMEGHSQIPDLYPMEISPIMEPLIINEVNNNELVPHGPGLEVVGSMPRKLPVDCGTKFTPRSGSHLIDQDVIPCTVAPAMTLAETEKENPDKIPDDSFGNKHGAFLRLQHADKVQNIQISDMDEFIDELAENEFSRLEEPSIRSLSLVEALNGKEGIEPVKLNTSVGPTLQILHPTVQKKADVCERHEDDNRVYFMKSEAGRNALKLCQHSWDVMGFDTRPLFLGLYKRKDEILPLTKHWRPRIFVSRDMHAYVCEKRILAPVQLEYVKHIDQVVPQLAADWTQYGNTLMQKFCNHGRIGFSLDFSAFDLTIPPVLIRAVGRLIYELYRLGHAPLSDLRRVKSLFNCLEAQFNIHGKHILRTTGTIPSGMWGTSLLDSLIVMVATYYVICHITGCDLAFVRKHFMLVAGGDDATLVVSDEAEHLLTPLQVAEAFKHLFGLTATPGRKDGGEIQYVKVPELIFLSRTFTRYRDIWLTTLKTDSLIKSMYFSKHNDPYLLRLEVNNMLADAAGHNPEFYQAFVKFMRDAGKFTNVPVFDIPTQDRMQKEQRKDILGSTSSVRFYDSYLTRDIISVFEDKFTGEIKPKTSEIDLTKTKLYNISMGFTNNKNCRRAVINSLIAGDIGVRNISDFVKFDLPEHNIDLKCRNKSASLPPADSLVSVWTLCHLWRGSINRKSLRQSQLRAAEVLSQAFPTGRALRITRQVQVTSLALVLAKMWVNLEPEERLQLLALRWPQLVEHLHKVLDQSAIERLKQTTTDVQSLFKATYQMELEAMSVHEILQFLTQYIRTMQEEETSNVFQVVNTSINLLVVFMVGLISSIQRSDFMVECDPKTFDPRLRDLLRPLVMTLAWDIRLVAVHPKAELIQPVLLGLPPNIVSSSDLLLSGTKQINASSDAEICSGSINNGQLMSLFIAHWYYQDRCAGEIEAHLTPALNSGNKLSRGN